MHSFHTLLARIEFTAQYTKLYNIKNLQEFYFNVTIELKICLPSTILKRDSFLIPYDKKPFICYEVAK